MSWRRRVSYRSRYLSELIAEIDTLVVPICGSMKLYNHLDESCQSRAEGYKTFRFKQVVTDGVPKLIAYPIYVETPMCDTAVNP